MELQSSCCDRQREQAAFACQLRPLVTGYDENRDRRWTIAGRMNVHVYDGGDGAAEVADDAATRRRPRGAAPWAIRGVAASD